MIYEGFFKNRVGNYIRVEFNTGVARESVTSNLTYGLSVIKEGLNYTVHSRKFRIVKGVVFEEYPTGDANDRFVKMRAYKGALYDFSQPATFASRYTFDFCELDIDGKIVNYSMGKNDTKYQYTATHNGYIYLNIHNNGTGSMKCTRMGDKIREIRFSSDPVTINTKSDGIFSPLKLNSATVRLMTEKPLFDLYTKDSQGVKCRIYNESTNTCLFVGYVTPFIYNQGYVYTNEELEIECVSPISTLDEVKMRESQDKYDTFRTYFDDIFLATGYYDDEYDHFVLHNTFHIGEDSNHWINMITINSDTLRDSDGEFISAKQFLENFCKTFCLTLVEANGEVFFLDMDKVDDENSGFTKFLFDGTTEVYNRPTKNIVVGYCDDSGEISMDDVYEKITIKAKVDPEETDYFDTYNEDDLICLHPNLPYITWTNSDSSIYSETYMKHVDIYRIYLNRNFTHYTYTSNFHADSGYGFEEQIGNTMSTNTFSSWWTTTDESNWKANFMNYFRSHLCCFVVKRFSYSYGTDNNFKKIGIPSSMNWENNLLISYGLNGSMLGGYSTSYQKDYSERLRLHYWEVNSRRILRNNNPLPKLFYQDGLSDGTKPINLDRYFQYNGSVYFMKFPYPNTGGDRQNTDLVKESADVYNPVKNNYFLSNPQIYKLIVGGTNIGTADYNFVIDRRTGSDHEVDRDKVRDGMKQLLYNWLSLDPLGYAFGGTNVPFTDGVPEASGHLQKFNFGEYFGYVAFTAPLPYAAANSVQCSFALVKDNSLKVVKQYYLKDVLDGKKLIDDKEYVFDNGKNGELEIELPYMTQPLDRELSKNALTYYGQYYFSNNNPVFYYNGIRNNISLEEMVATKYIKHYQFPKIIYNRKLDCSSITSDMSKLKHDKEPDFLLPYNVIKTDDDLSIYNEGYKTFIIDEIEYDVIDASKYIKLIEK